MDGASDSPHLSAERLAQALDMLAWPLMLTQADGHLLHANRPALRLLQRRQFFTLGAGGALQATHRSRRGAWSAALDQAASGQPSLLHWPGSVACTVVVQRLQGVATGPVLLLALSPASSEAAGHAIDSTTFASQHGLSPAEARVLQRLAQGESPARVAQALGVTVATVRSQSMAIRRKTGHRSLAQLISAVAQGSPLSSPGSAQGGLPTAGAAVRTPALEIAEGDGPGSAHLAAATTRPARTTAPAGAHLAPALQALLDQLDLGLLLALPDGQVLYRNPAAWQALAGLQVLRRDGRRVSAPRHPDAAALRDALTAAARGRRCTLQLQAKAPGLRVTVLPLAGEPPSDARPAPAAAATPALLVLDRPQGHALPQLQAFTRALGLTPSEARVLEGLCQGLRPAALSQQLSVALSTVRTHIGSLRSKAGTGSIRQLMHQLASLPPVLPPAIPPAPGANGRGSRPAAPEPAGDASA